MMDKPLLKIENVHQHFRLNQHWLDTVQFKGGKFRFNQQKLYALGGVSLTLTKGRVFCVVGESGCGKSTLARCVVGLIKPTSGKIYYQDKLINGKILPKQIQMVFQNPYASLNPRHTIGRTLSEPVRLNFKNLSESEINEKVDEVMVQVGANPRWKNRYPHEFSGGQRQRISIARAIATHCELLIADEPISALDVSIQAQVLNLLLDLKEQKDLTYLFITHDLSVVQHFGDEVAVMYLGHICEMGSVENIFKSPQHPYTQVLLHCAPKIGNKSIQPLTLQGEIKAPTFKIKGCAFAPRCPRAEDTCH